MRFCSTWISTARLTLFALPVVAAVSFANAQLPSAAQTIAAPSTVATPAPPAISGQAPRGTKADSMTPTELADIASRGITASGMLTEKYTYAESEHIQNFIDGQLVVDHTTVTENIFIHNLPYMRKVSVDGQPLAGKDLKRETALYDEAVKERVALDRAARANLERHALRSTSRTDLDKLATNFQLAVLGHEDIDGHDCVVLDATPKPDSTSPDLARHIRMDLDATDLEVLDIRIEFLADDNGFSKGTVLKTHYTLINGVPLESHHTEDTTVRFKELLGKAIRIHRDVTYTNYRRFHATVVIKMVSEAPADTPTTDTAASLDPKAAKKAKVEADKKAKADAKAEAKTKSDADKKAKPDATKNPPPPPSATAATSAIVAEPV